ncbi:globin domain-containing protein [Blastococcus atacamensis]|uniref:globin domain-containing protein n=1 Tax=Blastococcus atacamensis TaxID=2070508 RepID=UPI000CEBABEF|nr:globin domain-containing protein [Blastococcus atacamensis]
MLSEQSAAVVRATAGVVAEHAGAITAVFYPRMLAQHPELRNVFNAGNQTNGEQSRALAASIVAYAVQLIDPEAPSFTPVLERIAHKHVSLGIRPEQYTIVGHHLIAAVAEVLGDAVTPEVAVAWDEVYWLFAVSLIAEEARLYERGGIDPAHPFIPWRVAERVQETADVVSLLLEPADGRPVTAFLPGQYVTVAVDLPDGRRQPRQYTVSGTTDAGLRITVRRVAAKGDRPAGVVSTHLHDVVQVGDVLDVSAPAGDLTVPAGDGPLMLISAGIGITPIVAVLQHVSSATPHRPVVLAHADRAPETHALRTEVAHLAGALSDATAYTWYEAAAEGAGAVRAGRMDLTQIHLPSGVQVLMCGPLPFMRDARATLVRRGVPATDIRYEVFGPDLWAQTPPVA